MYMYPVLYNQFKMKLELSRKVEKTGEKRGESFQVSVKVGEWQDGESR